MIYRSMSSENSSFMFRIRKALSLYSAYMALSVNSDVLMAVCTDAMRLETARGAGSVSPKMRDVKVDSWPLSCVSHP